MPFFTSFSRVSLFLVIICVCGQGSGQNVEPLFLSPMIEDGQIEEAQSLSLVQDFYPGVISYNGFITVNKEYNSNLFFWFFPASTNSSDAPVLLWNEGGPAISGFHSLFNLNGPFIVNYDDKTLSLRNNSWNLNQNVIYLDSPVGVGFSFTENEEGNVHSSLEAAPDVYEFLLQFFNLFPHLQKNDFYIGGASYGATYAVAIGHQINTKNEEENPENRINFKGLVLESPWIDPMRQANYGPYLYAVGLIDHMTKNDYDEKWQSIQKLLNQQNYTGAFGIWSQLAFQDITTAVGYSPMYNILKDQPENQNFTDIVTSEQARKSLHVGNLTFNWVSLTVQANMQKNFMASVKPFLETLLNVGYKTIIYAGNLDVITCHLGVQNVINDLEWDGAEEYGNSTRSFWRVNNHLAGYVKTAGNLTHIMMRNAGHATNQDQSAWGLDLINKFIQNIPFSEK